MIFSPHNKQSGAEDAMRCYDIFSACQAWHFVVVEHVDQLLPFPSPLMPFLSLVLFFFNPLTADLAMLRK